MDKDLQLKANNIILYGIKESEKSPANLMEIVIKKIKEELNITVEGRDINSLYRIGKNATKNEKGSPILLSLVNNWMKIDIMKNKKKFKDAYASEDYPKEVLDKRKELQLKLEEEREKRKYAFINYDKLIIKENRPETEKRKREQTICPNAIEQPRKQELTIKSNRRNAFEVLKNRSIPPNVTPTENPTSEQKA
ncbi:unnamed protein product [Euphydryas editha]|uniref:Uncharacterized protein n=1 Tax=Euphydryas editha TaxID=104508 RepID=A0AAU9TLJ2_EUPED|nr:unnamed protein product [Euphydryas editha]